MPNIIKQGQIVEDNWQVWRDSDSLPDSECYCSARPLAGTA